MRTRFIVLFLVLVVSGVVGTIYYSVLPANSQFITASVDRGDIYQQISLVGVVKAQNTVEIGAEVSGRVAKVYAGEGDTVVKNQVLAEIADEHFRNAVVRSEANLQQALAARNKQRAAVQSIEARLNRRQENGSSLAFSKEDIESLSFELREGQADLQFAEAAVDLAKVEVERSKLELERTVIRSPLDGRILEQLVREGQTVNASLETPILFAITSGFDEMELVANVDEANIGKLRSGLEVQFSTDAYREKTFVATLKRTRNTPVRDLNYVAYPAIFKTVTDKDTPLLPGMTANITANVVEPVINVVRIPVDATRYKHASFRPQIPEVVKENVPRDQWEAAALGFDFGTLIRTGKTRVFVLDSKGNVLAREVTLGISNFDFVEVQSDEIRVGDRVILGLNLSGE